MRQIDNGHLTDAYGVPFPKRLTWKERWKAASSCAKTVVLLLVAFIAGMATLIANLQAVQDFFRSPPSPPDVPPIVVEITNSSDHPVDIITRGDFILWLPGPGARHAFGKYEFRKLDGSQIDTGLVTIEPDAKPRLLAQVLDEALYAMVFERADCDISFMVHRSTGGHQTTDDMPFAAGAVEKHFLTVDVGAD
ncbi:MAG TPA: hypothetical protein VM219_08385 [Phycisphaerae bacterium]|nr:hypothetical protein [Phycisphaerae bacterium]